MNSADNTFPEAFLQQLARQLDSKEREALLTALNEEPPVSIRFNPYKMASKPEGHGVPWNRYGFYLSERPLFTLDPLLHAGVYYVQEASSMFVEYLYRETIGDRQGVRLLDLCAAPGGKTTLYSTLAGAEGIVVANEVIRNRATILADNVRRWGIGNVAVTSNDTSRFAALGNLFDVVAVDAPCSGEGMFRKNPTARREWSPENVSLCAARQKRILSDAWEALKPGGILIYSTCTFNRAEDEEQIAWLAANFDCEPADITPPPAEWGIETGETEGIRTFRFWPHRVHGEGFFATAIRKAEGKHRSKLPKTAREPIAELPKNEVRILGRWVGQPDYMHFAGIGDLRYGFYEAGYDFVKTLAGPLNMLYSGVCMGKLFGGTLRPDHALALFHDLSREPVHEAEVTEENALDYLRKQELHDLSPLTEGLNLLSYQGVPLGWAKRIGARINSLLPNGMRIVNV